MRTRLLAAADAKRDQRFSPRGHRSFIKTLIYACVMDGTYGRTTIEPQYTIITVILLCTRELQCHLWKFRVIFFSRTRAAAKGVAQIHARQLCYRNESSGHDNFLRNNVMITITTIMMIIIKLVMLTRVPIECVRTDLHVRAPVARSLINLCASRGPGTNGSMCVQRSRDGPVSSKFVFLPYKNLIIILH